MLGCRAVPDGTSRLHIDPALGHSRRSRQSTPAHNVFPQPLLEATAGILAVSPMAMSLEGSS